MPKYKIVRGSVFKNGRSHRDGAEVDLEKETAARLGSNVVEVKASRGRPPKKSMLKTNPKKEG